MMEEIPEGYKSVWAALNPEREVVDVDENLMALVHRMGDKDVVYAKRWVENATEGAQQESA